MFFIIRMSKATHARMQGDEPAWQQRNNSTAYLGFLVTNISSCGRNVDFLRHDER